MREQMFCSFPIVNNSLLEHLSNTTYLTITQPTALRRRLRALICVYGSLAQLNLPRTMLRGTAACLRQSRHRGAQLRRCVAQVTTTPRGHRWTTPAQTRTYASVSAAELQFGQPIHETHPHLLGPGERMCDRLFDCGESPTFPVLTVEPQ
jgi:hypothetical protein